MKLACMMATAVIAFSAGTPQIVLAETTVTRQTEVKISNAADFIRTFLTEQVTDKDGKKSDQTITTVTDKNYEQILAARDFLEKADAGLKKAIETELEKQKIDWKNMTAQAEELQKKLKPETADKGTAADPATAAGQPAVKEPASESASSESGKQETSGQETADAGSGTAGSTAPDASSAQPGSGNRPETTEQPGSGNQSGTVQQPAADDQPGTAQQPVSGQPETEAGNASQSPSGSGSEGKQPEAEKPAAGSASDKKAEQESQTPAVAVQPGTEEASEDRTLPVSEDAGQPSAAAPEQSATVPEEPAASEQLETVEAEMPQTETRQAAAIGAITGVPTVSTPQAQTWTTPQQTTDAAAGFLSSWLTSSQGNLYGAATSQNQLRILGAMRSWNALSAADKAAVNTRLQSVTGKTFQQLVREAQQLQLGKPVVAARTRVHTAAQDQTGFFTGMLVGSLALFVLVAEKLKQMREEAAHNG